MKNNIWNTLFLITLSYCWTSYTMQTYEATMVVISTDRIDRFPAYMVTDESPYVNGGLIFTYPVGLFTTSPNVNVTIFAAPHANTITYTAEVCVETSSAATVMVYKNSSGVITEAANGEVNVYLTAIGT